MVMKLLEKTADYMKMTSAACVGLMIALTVIDVIGRAIDHPVEGAIETTGFLATLVLAFAMPDSHKHKIHIGVDILTRKMSSRMLSVMDTLTGTAACVLFVFICQQSYLYAVTLSESGERSMTLKLPVHLFIYAVSLSFGVLALLQAADVVTRFKKAVTK